MFTKSVGNKEVVVPDRHTWEDKAFEAAPAPGPQPVQKRDLQTGQPRTVKAQGGLSENYQEITLWYQGNQIWNFHRKSGSWGQSEGTLGRSLKDRQQSQFPRNCRDECLSSQWTVLWVQKCNIRKDLSELDSFQLNSSKFHCPNREIGERIIREKWNFTGKNGNIGIQIFRFTRKKWIVLYIVIKSKNRKGNGIFE